MVRNSFNKEKQPVINVISRFFCLIFFVITVYFLVRVGLTNLLPTQYFFVIFIILVILNVVFYLIAFRRRTKALAATIYTVISVILSFGMIYSSMKLNVISDFINKNFNDGKRYSIYNVIVNKKSKANSLKDLTGAELFTYEEPVKEVGNDALENAVKNTIADSTLVFKEDLDTVMYRPLKMLDVASVVNNGTYESHISVNPDYEAQVKIIGEIKIEITGQVNEETTVKKDTLADKPFLLYISGIDTRTNGMPSRSLSDVNILAAIDPNNKKILLVSIPRDTYVLIHGDEGLFDKLTHAGSRGGVELSLATIKDFMNVDPDRYIRVNFNFVMDLVDNIGGITVTSDADRTIKTAAYGCTINPGDNQVDGKCALGFARERKSYEGGDRQRGRNQEQVISRIIEKISKDSNLINDYGKILNALSGSFETNLSSDDIASLVKKQLSDMKSWSIESYNIEGTGTYAKTHSYPGRDLYVMNPDLNTVTTAKEKISLLLK